MDYSAQFFDGLRFLDQSLPAMPPRVISPGSVLVILARTAESSSDPIGHCALCSHAVQLIPEVMQVMDRVTPVCAVCATGLARIDALGTYMGQVQDL